MHKKYTYKDGKRYGPYLYENKRVGEKVITTYVGKQGGDTWVELIVLFVALSMIGTSVFLYNVGITGHAILDINDNYQYGQIINGSLKLSLKSGEFIPVDSSVRLVNGENVVSIPLSSLITESPSNGSFYVENTDISGSGFGFGVVGEKEIYPTLSFQLEITRGETDSSSESVQEEQESGVEEQEVVQEELQNTDETEPEVSGEVTSEENTELSVEDNGDSTSLITGAVVDEESKIIDGEVSKDKDFVYNLDNGDSASIVEGSVSYNEEELSVDLIDLDYGSGNIVVSTDYSIKSSGFGKEFLGEPSKIYTIDLSEFGMNLTDSSLEIFIEYNEIEIASAWKEINLEGNTEETENEVVQNESVTNETVVDEPFLNETNTNETIINQTIVNQTIINQTIVNQTEFNQTIINETQNISFFKIGDVPTLRIPKNSSVILNLNDYFEGAESYYLNVSDFSWNVEGDELNISSNVNVSGARQAQLIAYSGNKSLESNFVILVSSNTAVIVTSREKIIAGNPVKWVKNISLDSAENLTIEIPADAENISVLAIDNEEKREITSSVLTGNVVLESSEFDLLDWIRKLFSTFTGRVVDENLEKTEIEIVLDENATEYTIEYYTPAPEIFEYFDGENKKVVVSASDELNYSDVLAFTYLPFNLTNDEILGLSVIWQRENVEENIEIKNVSDVENITIVQEEVVPVLNNVTEEENSLLTGNVVAEVELEKSVEENSSEVISFVSQNMPFDYYDLDGDGLNEYIEWIVPHLSNQTFDIVIANYLVGNLSYPNITFYGDYATLNTTTSGSPYSALRRYWAFDNYLYFNNQSYVPDIARPSFPVNLFLNGTSIAPSPYGNALYLNGTSMLPTAGTGSNNDFSIMFWENSINASGRGIVQWSLRYGYNISFWIATGQDYNIYFNYGNGTLPINLSGGSITDGQWNHFAMTYNASINNFSVYRNGNLWNNTLTSTDPVFAGVSPVTIGGCYSCGNWSGYLDEIMYFTNEVTSQDIKDIYNNQSKRFDAQGNITGSPIQINQGSVADTLFNVSLDDYVISDKSNISVRLDSWDISRGYNNSDPNLVAYYHADGNALDSTGNGHNGVFNWDANSSGTRGYLNTSAFNFDSNGDIINITHSTLFETSTGSISAWVNTRGVVAGLDQQGVFNVIPDAGGGQVAYGLRIINHLGGVMLRTGATNFEVYGSGGPLIKNNTWHHVVATFDDSSNVRRVYVDGKLISTSNVAFSISFSGVNPTATSIGGRYTSPSTIDHAFNGSIDEVMVFNKTLSATEVNDLYFRGRANWNVSQEQNITENRNTFAYNMSSNILSCWIESEDDSCGSGSDGTLNGNAVYSSSGIDIRGNVLNLDGNGDYLILPPNNYTRPTGKNASFSLWMKPSRTDDGAALSTSHSGTGYYLGFSTGAIQCSSSQRFCFTIANDSGFAYQIISVSKFFFDIGKWHHVIGTYNGTDMVLYLDGLEIGRNSSVSGDLVYDSADASPCIGAESTGPGSCGANRFNGSIDEVAIWNRTLSDAEVKQIYLNSKEKHSNNQFFVSSQSTHILPVYILSSGANQFTTPSFYTSSVYPSIISSSGKWICEGGCLIFQNKSGHNVTAFDGFGNLALRRTVTQRDGSINPGPALGSGINAGFGIKDSTGDDILLLKPNSALDIYGTVFQNQGVECNPPARSFIIRNSSGQCVAYVNSTGHIWLKGRLIENVDL